MIKLGGFFGTDWASRMAMRWLQSQSKQAQSLTGAEFRRSVQRARAIDQAAKELVQQGRQRLNRPQFGTSPIHAPYNALWSWRPPLLTEATDRGFGAQVRSGTALDDSVQLFHNSENETICWHLRRNRGSTDLCAWSLWLENFAPEASYVSLVINLPDESYAHLNKDSLLQVEIIGEVEIPVAAQLRLSLESGPNSDQLAQNFELGNGVHKLELDLAEVELPGKRVTNAWIDVILARSGMNAMRFRDMTFAACPRAKI